MWVNNWKPEWEGGWAFGLLPVRSVPNTAEMDGGQWRSRAWWWRIWQAWLHSLCLGPPAVANRPSTADRPSAFHISLIRPYIWYFWFSSKCCLFLYVEGERGERMMVIFCNPTSIHLSRGGRIMRKSCGLGHRRYWFPGSPIHRVYASRRQYFWAERGNYEERWRFPRSKWILKRNQGEAACWCLRQSVVRLFCPRIGEKWSEMAGSGSGGQPGLILMTSNTKALYAQYNQYRGKKETQSIAEYEIWLTLQLTCYTFQPMRSLFTVIIQSDNILSTKKVNIALLLSTGLREAVIYYLADFR